MLEHVVRQGECLSSIAAHYGFTTWRTIYDHPSNAEFKAKRPNPNLIYPNDLLNIPDREPNPQGCQTEKHHKFKVKFEKTFLNVRLQDPEGEPIADTNYALEVEGLKYEDVTDGDGRVKQRIPAKAELGTLILWPDKEDRTQFLRWDLKLGHLDPIDTLSGVRKRLNNLDYDAGTAQGEEFDAALKAALLDFQEDSGLPQTGVNDSATRDELVKQHGV